MNGNDELPTLRLTFIIFGVEASFVASSVRLLTLLCFLVMGSLVTSIGDLWLLVGRILLSLFCLWFFGKITNERSNEVGIDGRRRFELESWGNRTT